VVDGKGGAVATTTTINGSYGSGVTLPGAGFLMNNEMDDFSSKPGYPNSYGLIQGEANSVGPKKRPLSAMTPTLVKKGGKLWMVLGSPGGPTIINTVFQIILNVVDHEMGIQQAVDAPRVHHQWLPDTLVAEAGAVVRDVQRALERRGHRITSRSSIGDAHSILIDPETGVRLGAPDPRVGESKASGF
jgi:gamma-glutamyltranspeptidase/glutathione hydrolase